MMKVDEKHTHWVALNLVLAEDLQTAKRLFARFPFLPDAFEAPEEELGTLGLDEEQASKLRSPRLLERASRDVARLEKKGYSILTVEDEAYPEQLREIFDPPFVLYCAGSSDVLKEEAVAIVGARKHTPYGRAIAESLAKDLASRGLVIVSGLARGIDSVAHWGALQGGKTVAVLGSGLENIYPPENRRLFDKIVEDGAVISEFPPDSKPLAHHFPLRNRIISGLALGIVVIEASRQSGSLISARLALEQNREVMAVPGNVTSEFSQGANWLIKNGAKLVETWEDVAEELPLPLRERLLAQEKNAKKVSPELSSEEQAVFECLKTDALTPVDELVERTEFSVSEILVILLNLEIKGLVFQSPGKCFQRSL